MKGGKQYILIADDEADIREVLTLLLEGEGYAVITAKDGQTAAELASPEIDLYILDVNMPRSSGFSAGAEIRRRFDTPIMFLTAYSGESDKLMGFSVGADDYLVKPFSTAELLVRIKAILRRRVEPAPTQAAPPANGRLPLGDLILDTNSHTLLRGEEIIPLTHTEFSILELLVTHRKRIFSPDHIYQSVWNDNAVGDAAIMVHIKNLRKKLGDDSRNPIYIKTAWGRGYYVD